MIKVGILGCGKIAQVRHAAEYHQNDQVELYGYYDHNSDRAEQLAAKYGGKVFPTSQALLADESIDAVSICTSNDTHAALTIAALTAGKDVLCEKPMAITLAECEEMVQVAKETGRKLMIGQNQRLTSAHQLAKKLLDEGAIGEVLTFKTTFGHGGPETWSIKPGKDTWFFDKRKAAMGVIADLGIHKLDLLFYLTGLRPVEVMAKVTTLDKKDEQGNLIQVDDNAILLLTLENGAIGTVSASWTYYQAEDNSTIIYGSSGNIQLYVEAEYAVVLAKNSGEVTKYHLDSIQTNQAQSTSGVIDAFIAALVTDQEPVVSGDSVLVAMTTVFAAIESAAKGAAIKL